MDKVLCIFLLLSSLAHSCELTKEYQEARNQVVKNLRYAYDACTSSVLSYYHWKEVARCEKEGRGEGVGGGCQHVAAYSVLQVEMNDDHCEGFKITTKEMRAYLQEYIKSENIKKCSTRRSSPTE